MSLTSISFPEGLTEEVEQATMVNTSGATVPYGGILMVDKVNLHATTLKEYKMIVPTAAGLLGTTIGRFGVCTDRNGIASNASGQFTFVSSEVEILIKASENIAVGNKIRPDHAGGTTYLGINDAGSAVGEHFVAEALAASNVAADALVKCRFNGLNFFGFRTV